VRTAPIGTRPLGSGAVAVFLRGLEKFLERPPWSSVAKLMTLPELLAREQLAGEADVLPAASA